MTSVFLFEENYVHFFVEEARRIQPKKNSIICEHLCFIGSCPIHIFPDWKSICFFSFFENKITYSCFAKGSFGAQIKKMYKDATSQNDICIRGRKKHGTQYASFPRNFFLSSGDFFHRRGIILLPIYWEFYFIQMDIFPCKLILLHIYIFFIHTFDMFYFDFLLFWHVVENVS